jgi:hypothetical protein
MRRTGGGVKPNARSLHGAPPRSFLATLLGLSRMCADDVAQVESGLVFHDALYQ